MLTSIDINHSKYQVVDSLLFSVPVLILMDLGKHLIFAKANVRNGYFGSNSLGNYKFIY